VRQYKSVYVLLVEVSCKTVAVCLVTVLVVACQLRS